MRYSGRVSVEIGSPISGGSATGGGTMISASRGLSCGRGPRISVTSTASRVSFSRSAATSLSSLGLLASIRIWRRLQRLLDDLAHGRVDALRGGVGEGLVLHDLAAKEDVLLAGAEIDRADLFAHAPETDHSPRELRRLLEVALRAGRDFVEGDAISAARPPSATDSRPSR